MKAIVYFDPIINHGISGTVSFKQSKSTHDVNVSIKLKGFGKSSDAHAIHIHEFGNISKGCMSAGPHFNPTGETHGTRTIKGMPRHAGDLINNIFPKRGKISTTFKDTMLSLFGKHSIIGRTVVIHEDEDDLGLGGLDDDGNVIDRAVHKESLKTGNAGGRMACAIIGIA